MGLVLILGCWVGMAGDGFPAWFNGRPDGWHPVAVPFEAVFEVLPNLDPLSSVAAFLRCVLLYLEFFWVGDGFCPRPRGQPLLLAPFLIFFPLAPGLVDPSSFMGNRLFQFLHFLSHARGVRPG